MIYHLLYPLHTTIAAFNVFRYITFRTIYASLTAFLICFLLGPWVIRRLSAMQVGQYIREEGPKEHQKKAGTPTYGRRTDHFCRNRCNDAVGRSDQPLCVDHAAGHVGIRGHRLCGRLPDAGEKTEPGPHRPSENGPHSCCWHCWLGCWPIWSPTFPPSSACRFFKRLTPDPGWGYIPFAALVIVGASNAVNLTDGLDGLAIGPVTIAAVTYMIFAYVAGHARIAEYLQITPVAGCGEITVYCGALAGAGLGFLWFNAYPAQVFMG